MGRAWRGRSRNPLPASLLCRSPSPVMWLVCPPTSLAWGSFQPGLQNSAAGPHRPSHPTILPAPGSGFPFFESNPWPSSFVKVPELMIAMDPNPIALRSCLIQGENPGVHPTMTIITPSHTHPALGNAPVTSVQLCSLGEGKHLGNLECPICYNKYGGLSSKGVFC